MVTGLHPGETKTKAPNLNSVATARFRGGQKFSWPLWEQNLNPFIMNGNTILFACPAKNSLFSDRNPAAERETHVLWKESDKEQTRQGAPLARWYELALPVRQKGFTWTLWCHGWLFVDMWNTFLWLTCDVNMSAKPTLTYRIFLKHRKIGYNVFYSWCIHMALVWIIVIEYTCQHRPWHTDRWAMTGECAGSLMLDRFPSSSAVVCGNGSGALGVMAFCPYAFSLCSEKKSGNVQGKMKLKWYRIKLNFCLNCVFVNMKVGKGPHSIISKSECHVASLPVGGPVH